MFDKTVSVWRRLDSLIPWMGLSLIVVARKETAPADHPLTCELKLKQHHEV
jgi:hypothetical protein